MKERDASAEVRLIAIAFGSVAPKIVLSVYLLSSFSFEREMCSINKESDEPQGDEFELIALPRCLNSFS